MAMANINVGELIVVNVLPTQTELNNGSITVGGVTKTFNFPVVFRVINPLASASVDYTYIDAVTPTTASFNPDLSFIDGLDIVGTELKGVKVELTVPANITVISDEAFRQKNITKVTLPEGLLSIGNNTFENNLLKDIALPTTLQDIGEKAFYYNKLSSVVIPEGITVLKTGVFRNNLIESANIPSTVIAILDSAFANNRLTSVTIPNSVTSIGNSAFSSNQLTSVTLPAGCTYKSDSFDVGVVITGGTLI